MNRAECVAHWLESRMREAWISEKTRAKGDRKKGNELSSMMRAFGL